MVLIAYGLTCFLIGSALFKRAAGGLDLKHPNVITWTYYYYVSMFLIPAFSNVIGLYSDWMARQAIYTDSAKLAFYATFASFAILPATVIILQKPLKIQPRLESKVLFESSKQNAGEKGDRGILLGLAILAVVLPLFLIFWAASIDLPIETLARGGGWLDMAIARRQYVMAEDKWIQYVKNIGGRWIASTASLAAFGYFLKRRSLFRLTLCIGLTVTTILFLFSSLEKAPIIHFLIALFYVWFIFNKGGAGKRLLMMTVTITVLGTLLFYITLRPDNLSQATAMFVERILFVQYSGTILAFDFFPRLEPFLGFRGLCHGLLGRLLNCDGVRYSLLLMQVYNPAGWAAGRVGYVSTLYIAEGYACFGLVGIIFSIFLAGIWLTSLQWLFFRMRLHPVSVGFLSLLMVRVLSFLGDGILAFVYPSEFIVPIVFVAMLIFWERGRLVLIIRRTPSRFAT